MDRDLTYRSVEAFPLRWRFFEDADKYTILPEEDRASFKPLSEESSGSLWDGWVRGILETLNRSIPTIYEGRENGWEQEVRHLLADRVRVHDAESLYFCWEPAVAVETTWGIFLKYWNDFCYPSDASNVVIVPKHPEAIVYFEEKFWIVPREDAPYTRQELDRLSEDARPWRGLYCGKCHNHIPQFAAISPQEEQRLRSLPTIEAFKELRRLTGCSVLWAKIWVFHPNGPHPDGPPCPYCGKPLRTTKAQQCFECGADWHEQTPATK